MASINLRLSRKLFNDAYYPYLFDYSNRINVFYGGAGSGKSHFVFDKIVIKACRSRRKVLVVRKVAATLKDSCFQVVLDALAKFHLLQYCHVNKSTYDITLPNGSIFLFKGLDNSEKIKSIAGITDIVIEEATELQLDDFTQLNLRMRAKETDQQIHLMFNPVSKVNWVYKYFFLQDTGALIVKTTYRDNKFLPAAYVENLERMKIFNPTYYRIYALGEFASLDKLVYTNWRKEEFNPAEVPGTHIFGLDFGYTNDPTALVCSIIDQNRKKLYIYDEYTKTGMLNSDIADMLHDKNLSKEIIIADSAEQKSIAELKKQGIRRIRESKKGPDSVLHGIQKLQQYEIIVHPSCVETITELENYAWIKDKQTNEYTNRPQDSFNHCLDALRYSIQSIDAAKLTVASKSILGL